MNAYIITHSFADLAVVNTINIWQSGRRDKRCQQTGGVINERIRARTGGLCSSATDRLCLDLFPIRLSCWATLSFTDPETVILWL